MQGFLMPLEARMAYERPPEVNDTTFLELLDAIAKPESPWHELSDLDKRRRLDLLSYDQRQAFGRHFQPALKLIAHVASLIYSLEQEDAAAVQAQYEEITKPVTRGGA